MKINLYCLLKWIGHATLLVVALTIYTLTEATAAPVGKQSTVQPSMQASTASWGSNDLDRSADRDVDDKNIAAKIKSSFMADPTVKSVYILVEVSNGVVQLSGIVDNQTQIMRALHIASGTEGVKSVSNNLVCGQEATGRGRQLFYSCNGYRRTSIN